MLKLENKTVELAMMLLHIGGLSGSATLISVGQLFEALLCALVASACVLLLTGATTLAAFIKVKAKDLIARQDGAEIPQTPQE